MVGTMRVKNTIIKHYFQLLAEKACSDSKVEDEEKVSREDPHWGPQEQAEDGPSSGRGLFDIKYHTLNSIGKGAFGFVKLAKRKIDEEEVLSEKGSVICIFY
jgi:hypothetical protein